MLQVYINGTYSGYATNALNYEFNGTAYSDDVWTLPVTCVWPISGMYSRLNRILYYLALVFALVVRHYEWLVAGALATATTFWSSSSTGLGTFTCSFTTLLASKHHGQASGKDQ